MAQFKKNEVLNTIRETAVVPVFYNGDVETGKKVLKACYDGGIRTFEFTNRGDKAVAVFRELAAYAATLPGMVLGIGSISFAVDARRFIRLGANFVVGPQFVPSVRTVCKLHGISYIPGCGTVSEVGRAQRAGCQICKVFPGDVLGPAFIKALKAPMPWSEIMVTGGVKPEKANLEAWFKAGASCVGMGSNLFPKDVIEAGDWAVITELCRKSLKTVQEVR